MGSTSPPQQVIGSVEASENLPSSQQGLNHKAWSSGRIRSSMGKTIGTMHAC